MRGAIKRVVTVQEFIAADFVVLIGMRLHQNCLAALGGADFKPGAVIGEPIRTILVLKFNRCEELSLATRLVINVTNLRK